MDYYHKHCQAYFEETVGVDPSPFLSPFARRLAPGARVLDVGCGSGRDLLWMKAQGFFPTGFEASPGLTDLARRHSGCPVVQGDFETFDFSVFQADAVMCCGSLVHVTHSRLEGALKNITKAFGREKGEKVLYISLKEGRGEAEDERGRIFYYWQDETLRPMFSGLGFWVDDFLRLLSADGEGKTWLGYVLVRSS